MNITQLDQTYLLQSYNQNQFSDNYPFHDKCAQNIKIQDSLFDDHIHNQINCQYSQSKQLFRPSITHQDKLGQNILESYKTNMQNYSSIELVSPLLTDHKLEDPYIKIFEIQSQQINQILNPLKSLEPINEFINELVTQNKRLKTDAQTRSQIMNEMREIIQMQNECIDGYKRQLEYIQKKYQQYDKFVSKMINSSKIKQSLNQETQNIIEKCFKNIITKIKEFNKQNKQRVSAKKAQNQYSIGSYKKNLQNTCSVKKNTKPYDSIRASNIKQLYQEVNYSDQNNGYIMNQAISQTQQRTKQQNRVTDYISKTRKRKKSETLCTQFNHPNQQFLIQNNTKHFASYNISEQRVVNEENINMEQKIDSYRQLTNFRIKQLQRDNQSYQNQLNSLRGKCIILRSENQQFKDIIQSLIREIKLQAQN